MSFRNRAHREDKPVVAASGVRGFTLLETTIAMVVMMVVGLGASSLFIYAVRSNSGGESRSQALAIAQQRLETLRTLPYDHDDLDIGTTESTVVLQDVEAGDAPGGVAAQSFAGGAQAYSASASGGGIATPSSNSGKGGGGGGGGGGGTPTPTPGGGGGGTTGSDDEFKVVVDVEGLPAGSANPTRKVIRITVTPENGYNAQSWINQNPVVIVIHRSSPATGPYRL